MSLARLSKRAEADLDAIREYIAAENPEAAERVRLAFLDTADLLAQYPEIGRRIIHSRPRHAAIRWFVVPQFRNYLIFYQPLGDSVVVLRILHAAQDWTRFFK